MKFVRDLGFPIFVAVWLLYQGERQHAANQLVMGQIRDELAKLAAAVTLVSMFVQENRRSIEKHEG